MKIAATLILMIITCQLNFSQSTSVLSVDYNRYFNNHNGYQRKNGISIAYEPEWKVKEYLYLSAGFKVWAAQEIYKYNLIYHYIDTISNFSTDPWDSYPSSDSTNVENIALRTDLYRYENNSVLLGVQTTFNVKINLYDSKLFLMSGINIGIENLFTFTDYAGIDPELGSKYPVTQYPRSRYISLGYNLGLLYEVTPRLGIFGEFFTTQSSDFTYNYVGLGMKIKVGKIDKEVSDNN